MQRRTFHSSLLAAAVAALCAQGALAQTRYPNRTITIVVGVQAGTGADVAVRTAAERLSASLKQPVVIENQASAGGVIGAAKVARAAPDGYTLAAVPAGIMTIRPLVGQKLPFDPFKDLAAVSYLAAFPTVLYVHPDLPVKTVAEFVELARKQPGKLSYASPGVGTTQHLAMEQLKMMAGIDLVHIPFQGSGQATTESVAGRVQAGFNGIATVGPYISTGKLRALAWAERQGSPINASLPTMQQSGFPDFGTEAALWLYAPAGTPADIIGLLNAEVRKAVADADLRARWLAGGIEPRAELSPADLDAIVKTEYSRNAKVIQEKGIKAD